MANNGLGLRVWTFDAGGPGVISGHLIVREIMRRLGNDLKMDPGNPPLPCDHADIMIGTHLGAVAALLMGRLRMSPDQVMDAIGTIGDRVFAEQMPSTMLSNGPLSEAPEPMSKLSSLDSLINGSSTSETGPPSSPQSTMSHDSSFARTFSIHLSPITEIAPSSPLQPSESCDSSFTRSFSSSLSPITLKASVEVSQPSHCAFSTERLREVVIQILERHGYNADTKLIGDTPRNQCKVAVVCASVRDVTDPILLRTYETLPPSHDEHTPSYYEYTIVDAVLATMATPKWFNPVTIVSGCDTETFIGGCMRTYNPIQEALKETQSTYEGYPVGSIISIGGGHHEVHELRQSTKDELNETLLKMMDDCDNTAEEVKDIFVRMPLYQRFSVIKKMDKIEIRDWSEDCFGNIATQTQTYIRMADVNDALNVVVNNLQGRATCVLPTVEAITSSLKLTMTDNLPTYSKDWQSCTDDNE